MPHVNSLASTKWPVVLFIDDNNAYSNDNTDAYTDNYNFNSPITLAE